MTSREQQEAIRPEPRPGQEPWLSLQEMARELPCDPGWIEMQVRLGLIPALRENGCLWFQPRVVRLIVADWEAHFRTVDDSHANEPLPALRFCDEEETSHGE